MKHFNSFRAILCGAAFLMAASCTADFFSATPAVTTDDQTTLSARAAAGTTVVDNGDGTVTKVITRAKKPTVANLVAAGTDLTKSGSEKWYVGAVSGTPRVR